MFSGISSSPLLESLWLSHAMEIVIWYFGVYCGVKATAPHMLGAMTADYKADDGGI